MNEDTNAGENQVMLIDPKGKDKAIVDAKMAKDWCTAHPDYSSRPLTPEEAGPAHA